MIKHNDFNAQLLKLEINKKIDLTLKEKQSAILLSGEVSGDLELDAYQSSICTESGLVKFNVEKPGYMLLVE